MPHHHLSIYGSHDSSICIKHSQNGFRVYELERLAKQRNYSLNNDADFESKLLTVKKLAEDEYGINSWGSCYYAQVQPHILEALGRIFGFIHFEQMSHHYGHAASGLYTSPFYEQCLVISSDSGGHEMNEGVQTFCVFEADRRTGIKKIATLPIDVCSPYTFLAIPLADIRKTDAMTGFLTYAGKLMGLAAYGNVVDEWIPAFTQFFYELCTIERLQQLGEEIGLDFSQINTVTGQTGYNVAATAQHVFENLTMQAILPFVHRYNMPVILTGGGALNVLMNQRFKNQINRPVYVPNMPNDSGLAFGFMALRNPPDAQLNVQYNGFALFDEYNLQPCVDEYKAQQVDAKHLARLLAKGAIIGVVQGNAEVGPRALGNRSILCNPAIAGMKDKLNAIKQREFYRPFAPVCKLHDVGTYFEFDGDAAYMTYAPNVRKKYVKKLAAITHADGTARVQTVTQQQNQLLYDIIDAVETITGIGVVLNTSFNIKGKPILNSVEDALHVLKTTELDYVYINGYLFEK